MRFSRSRKSQHSDDVILPLTNVVFLLLIFFLLAGRLTAPQPFSIDPPRSASEAPAASGTMQIQIAADGLLALDGEAMRLDQLRTRVGQRLQPADTTPLQIKADGGADANRVVAVMQALREAGAEKLRLITVTPQS